MPRVDMIHDRAVIFAYRLSAPSAGKIPGLPVFVNEPGQIFPPLRLVERITRHQKIPRQEICGAGNLASGNLLFLFLQPGVDFYPRTAVGTGPV